MKLITKDIYLNPKQLAYVSAQQKEKGFCGGRGSGKSSSNGVLSALNVVTMPRSKGALLGLTYNQILTKFLPPVIDIWEKFLLIEHTDTENGHFVIGKMPPRHWARPYQPPKNYNNVISFINGSCIELISFDRKNVNRGGNYDWMLIDEAQLLPLDRFEKELYPSVRGNIYRFGHNFRHLSICYTGSMPWVATGMWFPDMEKLAKAKPNDTFYVSATAWDNIHVLGEAYLKRLEAKLPRLTYQVEVMNMKLDKLPNCFYDEFDDQKHTYPEWYHYKDSEQGVEVLGDADYEPLLPLEISMDFNAKFTSMLVGQEHKPPKDWEFRFINQFYQKKDGQSVDINWSTDLAYAKDVISKCVQQFIDYYRGHKPYVYVWGDRNGNNASAGSALTFYQQIEKQLIDAGFSVQLKVDRRLDPLHRLKHFVLNQMLKGTNRTPKITMNQNKCKDAIISIQQSPVTPNFEKDKSSEQQDIPQEKATHLSDCFDNLLYPKFAQMIEQTNNADDSILIF